MLPCAFVRVAAKDTSTACRALKGFMLDLPKFRPVQICDHDAALRDILLPSDAVLPPAALATLSALHAEHGQREIRIGYDHMTAEQAMAALLPAGTSDFPSSYERAGHLAHLNLREALHEFKYIIGRILLDKNPGLRTVVMKTGIIDSTFRTFPMEVIAGEDDTLVETRACGARFRFDFRAVYWNSRLATEHEYMASTAIPPRAVVADVFAGVGPFAVPLAMPARGCTVHANDLNPSSYAALVANVALNKVASRVHCYNLDGRAFLHALVAAGVRFGHVLMNLPADALEFCDVFRGLYRGYPEQGAEVPLPHVHVYCFSKASTPDAAAVEVKSRLFRALGVHTDALPPAEGAQGWVRALWDGATVREVRDVAPKKLMLCVSFHLPRELAAAAAAEDGDEDAREASLEGRAVKRARMDVAVLGISDR